jgi:transcriptional regulator with XRE-family HTH domain
MKDKDGMIERFIELRKKFGPTQAKFGQLMGVSDVTVSLIESGKITINEKHIKLVCGIFGVNEDWFKTGKLPKYNEAVPGETEFLEIFRKLSPKNRKLILKIMAAALEEQKEEATEAPQNAPGSATRPPEAPQEAKTAQDRDTETAKNQPPETEKGERRADTSEKPV